MSDNIIEIRNLYKSYDGTHSRIEILNNLNFDIKSGESCAVVGASGIGKSTLLHILGTLDRPDSGTILFKGEDVFKYNETKLAGFRNETIGFVFQFHYLLAEFSAIENVMIPALINRIKTATAEEIAEEILIKVGLKDRLMHRVGKLSGGEQQRVALARALVLKPDILLADEPTGNLDKKTSEEVHHLLLELNQEFKMTLIVVTHNMDLASYMAREVTIINGLLEETG